MKNLNIVITLMLCLVLGGCLPNAIYTDKPYYNESMKKAQIEQAKVQMKQKQKIIQKNKSQTINIYQQNQPYRGYPEMLNNADKLAEARIQQREQARRLEEIRQQAQARQNSYARSQEEQARRHELAAQEARDIAQATQNSYATAREEQIRHQERAIQQAQQTEEARQMEQARQESLRTFAEEEARRQQGAVNENVGISQTAQAVASECEPNSGHLVQAGDLVMGLKQSKGGITPSHAEMAQHIQTNMAVSADQAEKILTELGI
jgi:hypothetical protein